MQLVTAASELLALAALFGFGGAAVTTIVRVILADVPAMRDRLFRKPFSCDLCMAWWTAALPVIFWTDFKTIPIALPATGIAWLVLTLGRHGEPPGSVLD